MNNHLRLKGYRLLVNVNKKEKPYTLVAHEFNLVCLLFYHFLDYLEHSDY